MLADVIFAQRNQYYDMFGLDMLQYLSSPHLAKDIMLKSTEAEIELLSDINMVECVRRGIRGGLSFVGKRLLELTQYTDGSTYEGGIPSSFINIDA